VDYLSGKISEFKKERTCIKEAVSAAKLKIEKRIKREGAGE
jgi:hypothetical protein